jgi:hypothetical protein
MLALRTRIETTALLMGLALAAACDSPTAEQNSGGGKTPPPIPTDSTATTVASVRIEPDTMTVLELGGHTRVEATARAASGVVLQGRGVTWTTSDAAIAVVDGSGNVTGIHTGRAWITASIDGRTAQARVDVIALTVDSIAMAAWKTIQWETTQGVGATLYAADGRVLTDRAITWTSSDPNVAFVDAEGRVTANRGGRAWITATSEGKSARTEVIVPDVKVMTLATADGRALPATVQDTVYDEGNGARRRVRVVATEGRLSMHSLMGVYQQRVVLRTYTRLGGCTPGGECIWEMDETVEERVMVDRGDIQYNVFTGEPIFVSTVEAGWTYYAQKAPADGYTVWQGVPGTGAVLPWLYRM